jgi:hypothetical protein
MKNEPNPPPQKENYVAKKLQIQRKILNETLKMGCAQPDTSKMSLTTKNSTLEKNERKTELKKTEISLYLIMWLCTQKT